MERRLARLHLRLNEPDRALAALAQVETGDHSPPEVEAEVLLGQAACLAAFDLPERARALLRASRDRRRWIWYSWHRLPLEWWDARITLRLGDLDDAIPRFDAVRRQHLDLRNWAEACLASLELLWPMSAPEPGRGKAVPTSSESSRRRAGPRVGRDGAALSQRARR